MGSRLRYSGVSLEFSRSQYYLRSSKPLLWVYNRTIRRCYLPQRREPRDARCRCSPGKRRRWPERLRTLFSPKFENQKSSFFVFPIFIISNSREIFAQEKENEVKHSDGGKMIFSLTLLSFFQIQGFVLCTGAEILQFHNFIRFYRHTIRVCVRDHCKCLNSEVNTSGDDLLKLFDFSQLTRIRLK